MPKEPPEPWYTHKIFILGVGILIGLLIGWLIDFTKIDIHDGAPEISTYDPQTGVITLPDTSANKRYWVTSEMLGDDNKGLGITSDEPASFFHHSCDGPINFRNLRGNFTYQLNPLYEHGPCGPSPSSPPTLSILGPGSGYTLVTKTGTIGLINASTGDPISCPIDVYTFRNDTRDETLCITIVLMDM